jgi:hypothetical protein
LFISICFANFRFSDVENGLLTAASALYYLKPKEWDDARTIRLMVDGIMGSAPGLSLSLCVSLHLKIQQPDVDRK